MQLGIVKKVLVDCILDQMNNIFWLDHLLRLP